MKYTHSVRVLSMLACWVIVAIQAFGQQNTTVTGQVFSLPPQAKIPNSLSAPSSGQELGGIVVVVKDSDNNQIIDRSITDKNGNYNLTFPAVCNCEIIVKAVGYKSIKWRVTSQAAVKNFHLSRESPVEFTRLIVGLQQAWATSFEGKRNIFVDLNVEVPFSKAKPTDDDLGPRFRTWGTVRIASTPQQYDIPVARAITNFPQQIGELKVSEVAQAAELAAGVEYRFFPWKRHIDIVNQDVVSLSVIAGGGMITPITPKETLEVFEASAEAKERYKLKDNIKYVAFVSADRDRPFRQYFAGLRLKTRYFKDGGDTGRYPGTLDITYGINESITGGAQQGGVFRLDGYLALPFSTRFVSFFGTWMFRATKAKVTDPLILRKPSEAVSVPGDNVTIIAVPQAKRDFHRIGIGIDVIGVIRAF